jgi:hypothetical protein
MIVPTILETQVTGFIGAAERVIRGKVWRVEWWSGQPAKFIHDGKERAWDDVKANRSAVALMMDSHKAFCGKPS